MEAAGFTLLGCFQPKPADDVPMLRDGRDPQAVYVVGSAGPAMWRAFEPWYREHLYADPLDAWTTMTLSEIANTLSLDVCYPFSGPPYLPFQRWAARAAPMWPSPLGVYVHETHGLWHGLRGALLSANPPDSCAGPLDAPSPCDSCETQPCLHSCPVSAFDGVRYDAGTCASHIASDAGSACRNGGCLARHACPLNAAERYPTAQYRFHMDAFAASRMY
jgi:hypothetical protein